MSLKKVLADIEIPFQLIPERQRNPIRHDGDRADNKRGMIPRKCNTTITRGSSHAPAPTPRYGTFLALE